MAERVELEQDRRMIGGAAGGERIDPREAEPAQVQFLDEDVHDPHRIVLGDEVLQTFGTQPALSPRLTGHKSRHARPALSGPFEF